MASRDSTRHGASANARRRTGATARSARGSSSRTRPTAPRRTSPTRTTSASGRRTSPGGRSRGSSRPARWSIKWKACAALATLVLVAWAFYPALQVHYVETREQARLESELETLKERNESLSAQVERLKTPEGVEEVARESLGMVKEGERLYVVLEEATATAQPEVAERPGDTLWTGLLDLVFGAR